MLNTHISGYAIRSLVHRFALLLQFLYLYHLIKHQDIVFDQIGEMRDQCPACNKNR
jgi:hypothetical protein